MSESERYAVFLDIDGTLTTNSRVPPEENLRAIEAVRRKGHKVFINTGRSRGNIPDEMMDGIKDFDGIVAGNGSYIILNGEVIFSKFLSHDLLRRICRYFLADDERCCLFEGCDGLFYIPDKGNRFSGANIVENEDDFDGKYKGREISVLAVGGTITEDFKKHFDSELNHFQFDTFADCVDKSCNKARGMDIMLEAVGIPLERTIAIGDSMNDYPMLEHAAIGIAMGNAEDALKRLADDITLTNTEFGVAASLKKYLL